ncbi:MAG: MBL fold metallo-hydrolase, partial [Phycisphaerae bacterium]
SAPMSDKIHAAVAKLPEQPVKCLNNTHWHGDHTGGTENFGKAGAIIVAHDNVRKRMNTEQFMEAFGRTVEASPPIALPIVTFSDTTTLYWNDEEIRVIHVDPAHTDGDSIIYFTKANVLHTGDCFFNGMYPFIDPSSGGSIDGMIAASERILELVNDETKIIPGHGPAGSAEDVREFRNMLQTARDNIQKLIDVGKTKDETIAAKPTAELDAKWGNGYFKPDMWVGIVYLGMKKD